MMAIRPAAAAISAGPSTGRVTDGLVAGNTGTSTLTAVHVAPSISAAGDVSFTGGGSAVTLDRTVTPQDPDGGEMLTSATVTVAGFVSGDILAANTAGASITASYDNLTGVLTLSGTDTVDDYHAVLRSVEYSFSPDNGDPTAAGAISAA